MQQLKTVAALSKVKNKNYTSYMSYSSYCRFF